MGLLDALLGRSKPVRPDLDRLFALPAAAVTLQAGAGLVPTGTGSVCFASVEGGAFQQLRRDVRELLDADLSRGAEAGVGPGAEAVIDTGAGTGSGAGTGNGPATAAESGAGTAEQSGTPVEFSQDEYGYTWLVARHPAQELGELVGDLHAVNTLLEENGFGPQLLCSFVAFRSEPGAEPARSLALVYLYKRGTFYPFAPHPGRKEKRDSELELQMRGLLTDDLPVEPDLGRWFPVWGAPGL
ncbi:PspA-associated protein PspAB [Streptomyces nanshensis]|uniref:Uncharacterized protein n=1 Tax=Streptomyces nanshensis TaxID=518642 RepID=A0A1E7KYZ0_9ACTN|nr:hypothetical protein [Streptomyces nanshensis]OEV09134.1 hypothetical protein AN218_23465 [Streptomyces nanshensis]